MYLTRRALLQMTEHWPTKQQTVHFYLQMLNPLLNLWHL